MKGRSNGPAVEKEDEKSEEGWCFKNVFEFGWGPFIYPFLIKWSRRGPGCNRVGRALDQGSAMHKIQGDRTPLPARGSKVAQLPA